jgi:GMP synthase (glutamine-hydrolysing)
MKIGILQTGMAPDALKDDLGDYPVLFARLLAGKGLSFETYRVVEGVFPPSVNACDGWLITGSRHGAYEDHPWIPRLEDFIRAAYAARVPLVGICFGHQIVAQAMGGQVERHPNGWAVGATDYDFGDKSLRLNAWHRDQVTQVPSMAKVIGRNAFCANAALLYDDRVFTVQAHPEFRPEFVNGLMETRGKGLVPDDLMDTARTRLPLPIDDHLMADQISDFFKMARA